MNNTDIKKRKDLIVTFSDLVRRVNLASKLGTDTYGGDRDIYNALGYPKSISETDYWSRYKRQDIAKAIIDRPVKASWKGHIEVIEDIDERLTPFEKKWKELFFKLKLKSIFIRADKLTGLGRYSVILLGLNDVKTLEDFRKPVLKNKNLDLLYVKPISEKNAKINTFDINVNSERFGLPETYSIETSDGSATKTVTVHYSRVVHLVEDLEENDVYGTPRLEVVYNRLIDLEKIVGGDAEMFWRGARPGYTGEVSSDYQMSDEAYEDLQNQIQEFEDNLRRVLINEGVKYDALEQQIADPLPHIDGQIQMISAVTGIPKRILIGSERGELSSAQDKQEWISYIISRREEQNEPMILRPFIDKLIEIGVLPKPVTYKIMWDKVFSLSDKEKVDVGAKRAEAVKDYTTNLIAQEIIPIGLFAEHFLAFDELQVEQLMDKINEEKLKEKTVTLEEKEILGKEKTEKTETIKKDKDNV